MATGIDSGDWRSKCKSVPERWCEALKRNLYSDVEFLVGEGDLARSFHAHKNILAFNSPVFEAMFFGELPEEKKIIPIPDIEPGAFEIFLSYVYGDAIMFPSVASAARTYLVADKYIVSDLLDLAERHVTKAMMDDAQFWDVMHADKLFTIPVVHKKCLEYLGHNASTLFKSRLMCNISSNVMQYILLLDRMYVTEYEVLSALVRWGHGNCSNRIKLGKKMEPLLCHIRFSNITMDEFCKFKDDHPSLIDDKDAFLIMRHIYKPSVYMLPKWCSVCNTNF